MNESSESTDIYVHADMPSHTVRYVAVAVAVVLLGLVGVLAFGGDKTDGSRLLGELVPRVQGATLDGEQYDIDEHRGEFVVVNFFASWCAPCRIEHPELEAFSQRHAETGDASVVGIVFQDQLADVQAFFDELGGSWSVVVEDSSRYAVAFGVTAAPETYLVSPDGVIIAVWRGAVSGADLESAMAQHSGLAS